MKKCLFFVLFFISSVSNLSAQDVPPPKAMLDSISYDPMLLARSLTETGSSLRSYYEVRRRGFLNTYSGLAIMGASGILLAADPGNKDNTSLYYVTGSLGFFLSLTGTFQISSSGKHLKNAATKLELSGTILRLKHEF